MVAAVLLPREGGRSLSLSTSRSHQISRALPLHGAWSRQHTASQQVYKSSTRTNFGKETHMPENPSTPELIRGVASHESSVIEGLLLARLENMEASGLDPRTYSLVCIAALVAARCRTGLVRLSNWSRTRRGCECRRDSRPAGCAQPNRGKRPHGGRGSRGGPGPRNRSGRGELNDALRQTTTVAESSRSGWCGFHGRQGRFEKGSGRKAAERATAKGRHCNQCRIRPCLPIRSNSRISRLQVPLRTRNSKKRRSES